MAASAPSTAIIEKSIVGSGLPFHQAANKFSVPGVPLEVEATGTLPNLKKPDRISIQVCGVEKKKPTNSRKLKTTKILNVITALSELYTLPPKMSGTRTTNNTP